MVRKKDLTNQPNVLINGWSQNNATIGNADHIANKKDKCY